MVCFVFLRLIFTLKPAIFETGLSVKGDMPSCKQWARDGDCETHQEFMLQNCRQSCKAGGYVNGESTVIKTSFRIH